MPAKALSEDPKARRDELLSNPKVKVWYDSRGLRSRLSADNDLRKLSLILYRLRFDPESVVTTASKEADEFQAVLVEYATSLKRSGRTDAHIVKTFNALRNYLRFRRVSFDGFPKLSASQATTLEKERIPTPDELGRLLERLGLRDRVVALFLAHTGVRPAVLGNYRGERGLTLGDLELDLGKEPRFSEVPFAVRVPADLSKTRKPYTTFGSAQLAETFLAYLSGRGQAGEKLAPTSPVIARTPATLLRGASRSSVDAHAGHFMWTHAVTDNLAKALHAAQPEGVTWRVYTLRSYLSTRLMLGPMNRDLREAILGHGLTSVSARYNVGKRWGSELLEEARREYAASAHLLETTPTKTDTRMDAFVRLLLEANGISPETIDRMASEGGLTPEKAIEVLREAGVGRKATTPTPPSRVGEQKLVAASEVEAWLSAGWSGKFAVGDRVMLEGVGPANGP